MRLAKLTVVPVDREDAVNVTAIAPHRRLPATMKIPMSFHDFALALRQHDNGAKIQDAFPSLNADQREFILTGITPDEWELMFPPEDEDESAEELIARERYDDSPDR